MRTIYVECGNCGKKFSRAAKRPKRNRYFCSRQCYFDWTKIAKENLASYKGGLTILRCDFCGNTLKRNKSQIHKNNFCNHKCQGEWYAQNIKGESHPNWKGGNVKILCSFCRTEFERGQAFTKGKEKQFCSRKCLGKWQSQYRIGKNNPLWKGRIKVSCAHCGKELKKTRYDLESRNNCFCSRKCLANWQSENQTGENNPLWGGRIRINCTYCGDEFTTKPYRTKRGKDIFCSRKCQGKWQSENRTGENSSNWKGGFLPYYGPNWLMQRERARKRDQYTCQHCGVKQQDLDRELDVHHIRPIREFGYVPGQNENYKKANHLKNLISLCRYCHALLENNPSLLPDSAARASGLPLPGDAVHQPPLFELQAST